MKLSSSPQPATKKKEFIPQYFSPSKSTIREYSISYAGSPGSSSEIDQINEYIPINNESSSHEFQKFSHDSSENTFLSANSRGSPCKYAIPKSESTYRILKNSFNDSNTNKKCQDLIKNSPIDKLMNFNDFIGKDMDKFLYISENDKKPVVKEPLSSRIYPISKNDFGIKGSFQEINSKPSIYKGESTKSSQFEEKKKMFSMSNLPNNNIQTIVKKKQENNNNTPKERPKTPIKYENNILYQNNILNQQESHPYALKSNYSIKPKENEKQTSASQLLNPSPKIKKTNGLISPENKDKISLDFLFFNKSKPQKPLSPSKHIPVDSYKTHDLNQKKHTKSFISEIVDNNEKICPPTFKKSFDISINQEPKKNVADYSPNLKRNYNNSFHTSQENSKKIHENFTQNKNTEINNNNNASASKPNKSPNDLTITKKTERSVSQYATPIFKDEIIKSNETGRYNEKNIESFEYSNNIIKKGVNIETKTNEYAEPLSLAGGKKSMNLSDKILNSERDVLKQKAFDIFRPKTPGLSCNSKLGDFSLKNNNSKNDLNQNNVSFKKENEKNKNAEAKQINLKNTQMTQSFKPNEKKSEDAIENEPTPKKPEKRSVSQVLSKNNFKENENETKENLENNKTPYIISKDKDKQSDIQNLPLSKSLKSLKSLEFTKEIDLPITKSAEVNIKDEAYNSNQDYNLSKKLKSLKSIEVPEIDNNEDESLKDTLPLEKMLPESKTFNENFDALDETLEKTFNTNENQAKKQEENNSNNNPVNEKPRGKSSISDNNTKERRSISQTQKTDNFYIKIISPEENNDKKQSELKKKSIKTHKKSEDINESATLKPLSNSIKKVSFTTNSSNETANSNEKTVSLKKPSLRSKNSLSEEDLSDKKPTKKENDLSISDSKVSEFEEDSNKKVRKSSKKNKKNLDDKNLESNDNEEFLDKFLKGSKTTRNQELIQKPNDQKFAMSPTSRAKSVCRKSKEKDESKMNFLNLNEFISTLGRGEVLPRKNSAKSPTDLHINLELLQKIAKEQQEEQEKSPKKKKNSKTSLLSASSSESENQLSPKKKGSTLSSTMTMSQSRKKSSIMPEIPEKPIKKDSQKIAEQKKGKENVISSTETFESEAYEDSESSRSKSNENDNENQLAEEEKLSAVPSFNSIEESCIFESVHEDPNFIYYMSNMKKFNTTACKSSYFKELYCEHLMQTFKAVSCIKSLNEVDEEILDKKKISLPKNPTHLNKKTLVFDLDETIIHCNDSLDMPCDVVLAIKLGNEHIIEAGVNIRPYALETLRELSEFFEIIVFTASHSCYANRVIDYLDPNKEFIHHRLFRDNCIMTEDKAYVKDLRIFENRDLKDIAIIDNACYSFAYHLENGIPIIPFYHNKNDEEFKHLKNYVMQFLDHDIRELNKKTFKLHLFGESENFKEILDKMFPDDES